MKEQILDQIPTPVMAVDKDLHLLYMNRAGTEILGKSATEADRLQLFRRRALHALPDGTLLHDQGDEVRGIVLRSYGAQHGQRQDPWLRITPCR